MAELPLASLAKAETKNYDQLTVEPRLLVADDLSVAIPNITSLSTDATYRQALMAKNPLAVPLNLVAVVAAALGLAALGMSRSPLGLALLATGIAVAIALVYWATTLKPVEKVPEKWTYFLHVTTSGPIGMHFQAPAKQTIDAVRRIISDKINDYDSASVYNINFGSGAIQNIGTGKLDAIGAIINGGGNQVAAGSGRVGLMEAHNAPGTQVGSTYRVDYSKQLPLIADWVRNFEQGGHADIARRLAELEQLMKEGSPNTQAKGRVRDLTRELTSLLGGAADISQFFGSISRLAGF